MLEYVAEIAEQRDTSLKILHLRDYHILPCGTCGDCNYRQRPCEQTDDMPALIEEVVAADGIIYATPVHGFGTGHLMQIFIERAGVGYLRFKRPLANKIGGVIVTGRRYNHSQVYTQLVLNLLLNRMILVGSGFPPLVQGGKPGEGLSDSEGLDAVQRMVNRMIDMVCLLKDYAKLTHVPALALDDENERVVLANSRGR